MILSRILGRIGAKGEAIWMKFKWPSIPENFKWWAFGIVLGVIVGGSIVWTPRYTPCPPYEGARYTCNAQGPDDEHRSLRFAISDWVVRNHDLVDGLGVAATAFFTLALFVSTFMLWDVTKGTLDHARRDSKRQSDEMQASIAAAQQSADAAKKAIKVTRDIGRTQARAYLGFDVVYGAVVAGKPIRFQVRIKNHGISPANEAAIASSVVVRGKHWEWGDEVYQPLPDSRPSITIHPSGHYDIFPDMDPPQIMTEHIISMLRAEEACVFCRVTAIFMDEFRQNWEVGFFFEFSGEDCFRHGKPRISAKGNYKNRIERQNLENPEP